ncbi:UDP-N-acetylmuramate dehydrogenase [Microbacterium natoriense]|uniref:UDP-N-acetylenolpyruvoylglucosamine reductase n=1 Tax=Microbacterium natoriense TaxID=284570 RepID=A0AAW8F225_9MICO|nr:UDP-N-acetylmuramate dehydrogenase [Microbacterium natoriense]MDQ0649287.1 UDP-N-acetylmuramate dehydrogenase [Microbacterium natoriense]
MREVEPIRLSALTTLQTGAAPERMLEANTTAELVDALQDVWARGDDWFVLGGGSNLFVGDEPFEGTVIRVLTRGIEELPSPHPGRIRLRAQAGHGWDDLVAYAVQHGYAGLEAMSGIPGTVGAAPVQNIGAYGQEIQETLAEVELLDEHTSEIVTVPASDLGLGFRTSVFKHHYGSEPQRRAVILSITVDLAVAGERVVRGAQLRRALGLESDEPVLLSWVRERILSTRASKGMLLDANDPDTHGVGSFFQNAIVPESVARALPPECPQWPVTPDLDAVTVIPLTSYDGLVPQPVQMQKRAEVKVSAAWLIEQAGIRKGFKLPRSRASVSTKHALALTNRGGASAAEVSELARFIQSRVHSEFGLVLQPEPVLVGVEL